MFFGPQFFRGKLPEFLESIYKTDTGSDHVAKFRGDRPRELGDLAAKKKKHHKHFIRPPVTPYGRPNQLYIAVHKFKKLSYCWETVRRESLPEIAEMDVEMTTYRLK